MVLSRSQVVPDHIRSCSHGRYLCDKNCPQWMSSQIGSHTLTVAEQNKELLQFLQWYVASGQGPNLGCIGLSGLPKGRGQKRGRPKQKRTRSLTPGPDNYTLQPGLASPLCESYAESDRPCSSTGLTSQFQPVSVSTQVLPGQFKRTFKSNNLRCARTYKYAKQCTKLKCASLTYVQHLMKQLFLLLLDPNL